uniref:Uncharacterized protein n=1 Tax=Cacopsylla melanoneura TaxID=428564 RepID=A0A8D8WNM0_9HEMI
MLSTRTEVSITSPGMMKDYETRGLISTRGMTEAVTMALEMREATIMSRETIGILITGQEKIGITSIIHPEMKGRINTTTVMREKREVVIIINPRIMIGTINTTNMVGVMNNMMVQLCQITGEIDTIEDLITRTMIETMIGVTLEKVETLIVIIMIEDIAIEIAVMVDAMTEQEGKTMVLVAIDRDLLVQEDL